MCYTRSSHTLPPFEGDTQSPVSFCSCRNTEVTDEALAIRPLRCDFCESPMEAHLHRMLSLPATRDGPEACLSGVSTTGPHAECAHDTQPAQRRPARGRLCCRGAACSAGCASAGGLGPSSATRPLHVCVVFPSHRPRSQSGIFIGLVFQDILGHVVVSALPPKGVCDEQNLR